MKKIVIIGANSFQKPLIERASDLGFETHVFAWREGAVGAQAADYFYPISITQTQAILEQCRKIKPTAVATIASDLALCTVAYLAQALDLPGNSAECIRLSTNKFEMRKALAAAGLRSPKFASVSPSDPLEQIVKDMQFPLIAKPTDRSGSRGITKINSPNELSKAIAGAASPSFEQRAIVEEFIQGDEYSCESISFEGTHHFLAMTKKFTTGAPHFIETGHIQPSGLGPAKEQEIAAEIHQALDALNIQSGASHAEFRLDAAGRVHIIEIGARMGGDCIGSHLVPLSTGQDFLGMVIACSCGQPPVFKSHVSSGAAAIRFVFSQKDIDCLEHIRRVSAESIQTVSPIAKPGTQEIVDSSTRLGYYIIADQSETTVKQLLELTA